MICLLCNGLVDVLIPCSVCQSTLEDAGAKQNLLDPYSPYEEYETKLVCTHVLTCHLCGMEQTFSFASDVPI
ncbi:MAG: hypothetical protein ACRC5C_13925 [Bacilli bacterium]